MRPSSVRAPRRGRRCSSPSRSFTIGSACTRPWDTEPRPRLAPAWRPSPYAQRRDILIYPLHTKGGGPKGGKPAAATPSRWSDEDLQRAAPLFTTAWLFDVLPRALGLDQPTLHNSEGDEVVFHEVTFPLAPTASTEEVAHRLNERP